TTPPGARARPAPSSDGDAWNLPAAVRQTELAAKNRSMPGKKKGSKLNPAAARVGESHSGPGRAHGRVLSASTPPGAAFQDAPSVRSVPPLRDRPTSWPAWMS